MRRSWSQIGTWHFKLLALVRQCSPTSVKQPPPCAPPLTYLFMILPLAKLGALSNVLPCHWELPTFWWAPFSNSHPGWTKTQICATCLPQGHNCFLQCLSRSSSFSHLPGPHPSDFKVPRKPPQVPTCHPKHLVPGVGAKEGPCLGSTWALFCRLPQGWDFSHLAGFPSLSPVWVLRFQQYRPWQKGPPPSRHTSEVFIPCRDCDLARMGFGWLSVSHRPSVSVSPAWTLVLISP